MDKKMIDTSALISGVDISSLQGNIDIAKLAQTYKFLIHRCFVGNDYKDTKYDSNIRAAKDAGMAVAAYHFAYPLPNDLTKPSHDPIKQANLHYQACLDSVSLVVLDLEWPYAQDWTKWKCTAQQIKDWTKAWLIEYERLSGNKPIIYTYPSFAQSLNMDASFPDYDLWIASYTTEPHIPAPWKDWVMWQNTGGSTHFDGIAIDTDYCKDLSIFSVSNQAPPTAQPEEPAAPFTDPSQVEQDPPPSS